MNTDYKNYLNKWLTGIEEELNFWNDYMDTQGDIYQGKEFKFIDVGSGPFSRCGKITEKVNMNFTAADPLAEAYNIMKKINKLIMALKLIQHL